MSGKKSAQIRRLITLFIISIAILGGVLVYYFNVKIYVPLTLVSNNNYSYSNNFNKLIWFTVKSEKDAQYLYKDYNINLPNIDYSKRMFVVSIGSEIESVYYTRGSRSESDWNEYVCFCTFQSKTFSNAVFIYECERIDMIDSVKAGFQPEWLQK